MLKKLKNIFSKKNISIFRNITKTNLSVMNSGVVVYGYILTAPIIKPIVLISLFCGTLPIAMASQVKGQIMERDFDSKMDRTKNRPLPLNEITIKNANMINWGLLLSSNFILYIGGVGFMPIIISNTTYLSYLFYIHSKTRSKLNTIIGSFPGSFPILIGITANLDFTQMDYTSIVAFSYLFLWNIVHFYAIYITFYNDYKKTDFKNFSFKSIPYLDLFCSLLQFFLIFYWLKKMEKNSDSVSKSLFHLLQIIFFLQFSSIFYNVYNYIKKPNLKYGAIFRNISYRMLATHFTIFFFVKLINDYKKTQMKQNNSK